MVKEKPRNWVSFFRQGKPAMTVFHVGATFLLTSLYTFITIFVCVFPWLGEDTIRTPPPMLEKEKKKGEQDVEDSDLPF